ncbi:MAG: ComEC/Rec2 family competence protein [Bacteroidales bacterium]
MSVLISDFRKVPVVRVAIPFASGLALHGQMQVLNGVTIFFVVVGIILVTLLLAYCFFRLRGTVGHVVFGVGVILFFYISGIVMGSFTIPTKASDLHERSGFIAGWIKDSPVEKERSWVVQIEAAYFFTDTAILQLRENMQVYLKKETDISGLIPGTFWLFMGETVAIRNRGNPGEFDYASFMQRRNFRYNLFCSSVRCLNPQSVPRYLPARIRQKIISNWDSDEAGAAVLSAITLGYKTLLDRSTRQAFTDAGAMHLLAVSGLHVGIVWWILDLLLRFPRYSGFWRTTKLLIILVILWFYATITGLSESVTRSVTMFSLVAFSKTVNRQSNIYNTLLLSGFLLLFLKPDRIMEPGFQLSYLAVFGIITIQPLCGKLYVSCIKPIRWILDLVSVSIAAQLATLPLVLLYFNQFPVWFILTNLGAIPLVTLILVLFVLFSPFLIFFPDITVFSFLLLKLASLLNSLINLISSLPFTVISDITIHPLVAFSILVDIVAMVVLLIYRRFIFLLILLASIMLTCWLSVIINKEQAERSTLEVYNFSRVTVLSEISGGVRNTYVISGDQPIDPYTGDYIYSLGRNPVFLREHNIMNLQKDDSATAEDVYLIGEGLWAIRAGEQDVLLAGRCSKRELQGILEEHKWNMVIFCQGFPHIDKNIHLPYVSSIIGDGTLRDYEIKNLKKLFPDSYIVKYDGAYVYDLKMNRGGSDACIK